MLSHTSYAQKYVGIIHLPLDRTYGTTFCIFNTTIPLAPRHFLVSSSPQWSCTVTWRMRWRVTVVVLCVYLSVCYQANCYIPCLRVQSAVL